MVTAVRFTENRVWRVYLGGAGIDALRHSATQSDNHFPEDWIASCTEANNPQHIQAGQGLSRIETASGSQLFKDYLESNPLETLGRRHLGKYGSAPGFLAKILDAAERLPLQVHPSVPYAMAHFNSNHGKTECWYILGTREINGEPACLLLGFNEQLDREQFLEEARSGEFRTAERMFHRHYVKPGDVFLVPGGTPHAIGAGITLVELMEPSDLVVQPEKFCGSQPIAEAERFSGAPMEEALGAFDFTPESMAQVLSRCSPAAQIIAKQSDSILKRIMPLTLAKYFEEQHLECHGTWQFKNLEECCRAGIVTSGHFTLQSANAPALELPQGCAFFMPFALKEAVFKGEGEILFTLPDFLP